MKRGDLVKFREVVDAGDEAREFVVLEVLEARPALKQIEEAMVQALGTGLRFPPVSRYATADLVVVGHVNA